MDTPITDILLAIIAIALSVLAVRVNLSFNLNEYLEKRNEYLKTKHEKLVQRAQNYCPHAIISQRDGRIKIETSFIAPMGNTYDIYCQRCGSWEYQTPHHEEERIARLNENIHAFKKQEKLFQKYAKKAGIL